MMQDATLHSSSAATSLPTCTRGGLHFRGPAPLKERGLFLIPQ
jgi:hypothetical protein